MLTSETIPGTKVYYTSSDGTKENGIIKSLHPRNQNIVFVVYACNDDWGNYENYTGVQTHIFNLVAGWAEDTQSEQ